MNNNIIPAIAIRLAVLGGFAAIATFGAVAAPLVSEVAPGVSQDDVTGSIASPSEESRGPLRVTCHNGLARDGQKQQRGWFCRLDPERAH
ncbi:hypothetical protein [Methylocella sp.]|uniref:hypothetical protein n=1 Tax=Methylocella sp. TaxID=1978226 RepID=UPI003783838A